MRPCCPAAFGGNLDWRHALSGQRARSARHRLVPFRHRLPAAVAARLVEERCVAAPLRLAGDRRTWRAVFRPVPDPVQRVVDLHDGGPRFARAVDAAIVDHACRRRARQRGPDVAQIRRCADRNGRRCAGLAVRIVRRPGGRLAWRSPDGRRRALHGVLQHLVATVHPPLRSDSLHGDGDGRWRALPDPGLSFLARQFRHRLRHSARRNGARRFISAPLAPHSPFTSGRSPCSGPRRRVSRSR